ncbi:11567_t:CDS:2, partial [Acaulospora colombiana]
MPSLKVVQASNTSYSPSYIPTAVFIGGTSGLGQSMAEIFAEQTGGRANIIIVGRDKAAADKIIARFPSPSTSSADSNKRVAVKHEFIYCDASLMKNVHEAAQQIASKVDKINYLVCSIGGVGLVRTETEEGNEVSLSLRAYARLKFFHELLPLVQKAKAAGEDGRIMSILAAGLGGSIDLNDLEVTQGFGMMKGNAYTATYNDVMIKVLSKQHPDLTFIHMFPGVAYTPALHVTWWSSILATLFKPLIRQPRDAGNFLLYPLLSPDFRTGGFHLSPNADEVALPDSMTEEVTEKSHPFTGKITMGDVLDSMLDLMRYIIPLSNKGDHSANTVDRSFLFQTAATYLDILTITMRLPPTRIEENLNALLGICPEYADDLLGSVDQPLKVLTDKTTGKEYLACDYNRDGDSYRCGSCLFILFIDYYEHYKHEMRLMVYTRSPWSNEYDPPLDDGTVPSAKLRRLEVAANEAFDTYRE